MATFFSNQTVWYWGTTAYLVQGTLTGDVTRSGNTVTLSNMSLALSWPPYASGAWDVSFSLNGVAVYSARLGANTSSINLNNYSFGVSESQTSASVGWSTSDGYSGSFTVTFPSGATGPSGAYVNFVSSTWNSVQTQIGVSSWGTGYSGTPSLSHNVIVSSATSSNWTTSARRGLTDTTSNLSSTKTLTNDNTVIRDGGINIRGCLSYKIGCYANNGVGVDTAFDNTTRYTPPAPLQTLSKSSETYAGSNKSNVTISITGGNSTDNNNVTVSTQYRYSTNGGSSWTAWAQVGTGTPWTAKSVTFQVPCNTSIQVQARQVYQSQSSEIKSLTFTSMKTPAMLYVPVSGQSKLARKAYIGINGQSEKVLKIYKGVNGQAKLVYTD